MIRIVVVGIVFISNAANVASIYPHLNPDYPGINPFRVDRHFNLSAAYDKLFERYRRYVTERHREIVPLNNFVHRPNHTEVIDGRTTVFDILYEAVGCKLKNFSTVHRHRNVFVNYTATSIQTTVLFRLATRQLTCDSISYTIYGTRYSDSAVNVTFGMMQFQLTATVRVKPTCRIRFEKVMWNRIEDADFDLSYKNVYDYLPSLAEMCMIEHMVAHFRTIIEPMLEADLRYAIENEDLCKYLDFSKV